MSQIPRDQKGRTGFEGAFQKAVIRFIQRHCQRHSGVNEQRRAGQVREQGVDAGGLETEFRAMEDLLVLSQDGWRDAEVDTLHQGQRHEHGRDAAWFQGGGDEHVGIVDHPHGQDTCGRCSSRTAAISASISSNDRRDAPLRRACSCNAARDSGVWAMACKKSSTPRMTAVASPFLVTRNRSWCLETRSRIWPNCVRARKAGRLLVKNLVSGSGIGTLSLINPCMHSWIQYAEKSDGCQRASY